MNNIVIMFKGDRFGFLSNMTRCVIQGDDGLQYNSVEAAYQAHKTTDMNIRQKFSSLQTGMEAKQLSRSLTPMEEFLNSRIEIMRSLLEKKFSSDNPVLCSLLMSLKGIYLVEGNFWHDNFWGACTCTKCNDIDKFNHLGNLLMQRRDSLIGE